MREFTIDGIKYREIGGDIEDGSLVVITKFNSHDIDPVVRTIVDGGWDHRMYVLNEYIDGLGDILDTAYRACDEFFIVEKVETEPELPKISVKLVDKSTYIFRADRSTLDGYFIKFIDKCGNVVAKFPSNKVMSVVVDKEVDVYEYD